MQRRKLLLATASFVLTLCSITWAQSRMISRFDTDGDGKIKRSEVPESMRDIYDRMVRSKGLDPEKTIDRAELEKAMELNASSVSSPTIGTSSSDSGRGRSFSRRPTIPQGRQYRSLVELPSQYRDYDKDGDGQIGLYEWPRSRIGEFQGLDKNGNGFLEYRELNPSGASARRESSPDSKPAGPPPGPGSPDANRPPSGGPPPAGPSPPPGAPSATPNGPPSAKPSGEVIRIEVSPKS